MKVILECPNCKSQKEITVKAGQLSAKAMKEVFKNNNTSCDTCRKNGVGRITMVVTKFDMEKPQVGSVRREGEQHAPIHIEPGSISPEQLKKNIKRELTST